jgi:hypothetical protein
MANNSLYNYEKLVIENYDNPMTRTAFDQHLNDLKLKFEMNWDDTCNKYSMKTVVCTSFGFGSLLCFGASLAAPPLAVLGALFGGISLTTGISYLSDRPSHAEQALREQFPDYKDYHSYDYRTPHFMSVINPETNAKDMIQYYYKNNSFEIHIIDNDLFNYDRIAELSDIEMDGALEVF